MRHQSRISTMQSGDAVKRFEAAPVLPVHTSPGCDRLAGAASLLSVSVARVQQRYREVDAALCSEEVKQVSFDMLQASCSAIGLTPIEQLMWIELYAIWKRDGRIVSIRQQEQIGDYRVDFLVTGLSPITQDIIVECDGHDFHAKTKEQAQRDRSMDRKLQFLGFKVLDSPGPRYGGTLEDARLR